MVEYITYALMAISILGFVTSAIVEVIKTVFGVKKDSSVNVLVFVVSEILTMITVIAVTEILSIQIIWYYIALAVIAGIIVCGIAIFGFDKYFKTLFKNIQSVFTYFVKK